MKKISLMALAALTIFSCSKSVLNEDKKEDVSGEKNVTVRVSFESNKKSIEDPSAGADRDKVKAEIKDLQIIGYDASGAVISKNNITSIADLRKALSGKGTIVGDTDTSELAGTGLVIGVPSNIARMDVMANFATADVTTNVNDYQGFQNSPLVSIDYLRYIANPKVELPGKAINKKAGTTTDPHLFETTISSAAARFEVGGSIPMKPAEVYTNPAGKRYLKDKVSGAYLEEGTDPFNTYVQANPTEANNFVTYFPNGYYAVDVEEIFINNIYVRGGATNSAYGLINPGKVPENAGGDAGEGDRDRWYKEHFCGSGVNDKTSGHGYDPNSSHAMMMWQKLRSKGGENYISATPGPARQHGIQQGKVAAFNIYQQGLRTTGFRVTPPITETEIITGMDAIKGSDAYNKFLASVRLYGTHIILRVKCYASEEDYKNKTHIQGKEFITVRSFSMDTPITNMCGSNKIVYEFLRNYIYRLDLADLQGEFGPNDPTTPSVPPVNPVDPDPEDEAANVQVKVQVLDWTIVNLKPVI